MCSLTISEDNTSNVACIMTFTLKGMQSRNGKRPSWSLPRQYHIESHGENSLDLVLKLSECPETIFQLLTLYMLTHIHILSYFLLLSCPLHILALFINPLVFQQR